MWPLLDGHSLAAVYGFMFLAPFVTAYLIGKLATWWRR